MGLVVAYTWNREKQMFVALGKEFDMAFDCGRFRCIIKNEFTLSQILLKSRNYLIARTILFNQSQHYFPLLLLENILPLIAGSHRYEPLKPNQFSSIYRGYYRDAHLAVGKRFSFIS